MRKSCDDLQVANDVEELMFRERLKKKTKKVGAERRVEQERRRKSKKNKTIRD